MKLPKLQKLRESKGYTQDQLAELTGLSRGSIGNYESGGGAKLINAEKIASILQVRVEEMLADGASASESRSLSPFWNDDGEGVPYYDVDVFAGDVIAINDMNFKPISYIKMPGANDCDFGCRVSGNSMTNKIYPGAIILCKEIRNKEIIAYGEVHLVSTDEQRLVKIIRKHPTKADSLLLRSLNPEFDDIELKRHDIIRLFLVKVIVNQEQM